MDDTAPLTREGMRDNENSHKRNHFDCHAFLELNVKQSVREYVAVYLHCREWVVCSF